MTHTTTVLYKLAEPSGRYLTRRTYRAVSCSCGWQGPWRYRTRRLELDEEQHHYRQLESIETYRDLTLHLLRRHPCTMATLSTGWLQDEDSRYKLTKGHDELIQLHDRMHRYNRFRRASNGRGRPGTHHLTTHEHLPEDRPTAETMQQVDELIQRFLETAATAPATAPVIELPEWL